MSTTEGSRNRIDFLTSIAGLAATLAIGFGAYEYQRLNSHVERLSGVSSGLSVSLARGLEQIDQHEKRAGIWIDRIESNTVELQDLATDARARPDAFTGADGAALRELIDSNERRIDRTERGVDSLDDLRQRFDALADDFRETQGYYRRQVLPLIEQSNSLQMQRNMQ